MFTSRNVIIIITLALSASCKLTEQSVTGKWISGSDTLFINQDHTFLFADRKDYYSTKDSTTIFDTSFTYSSGQWTVSKRTLHLTFKEDKKAAFGNCDELWNWGTFFSRYKLIRPAHCFEPSNTFVGFNKIKK